MPYLSTLEVCSQRGAIQIHVYLTLPHLSLFSQFSGKVNLNIHDIIYFTGGSLKKYIKQYGPFRDKEIVNYSYQLLCGLKYLHENNIVHHDIKGIIQFLK